MLVALVGVLACSVPAPAAAAPPPREAPAGPVFVEFDRPSALTEYLAGLDAGPDVARGAAVAARQAIEGLAEEVVGGVRGVEGVRELFRTTNAVPGVALHADAATARRLAMAPGVRSVRRLGLAEPADGGAVELGGAVAAWQATGRLGRGVTIGVIDSGIDYTHADFGGPGTPEAFAAVDGTTRDGAGFPTGKVVGGVDLVGDDYSADSDDPARATPRPDPNPLDCGGHGTHVSGIAAGLGVTADGAPFRGDHTALDPAAVDAMRIAPGAAPAAALYAIRVFGCSGPTAAVAAGLDHALDPDGDGDLADRLDVVNLSLGMSESAPDDPVNDFVAALARAGVLVVAAAGNAGDVYDVAGAPGNSPHALAVANVRDPGAVLDAVEVVAPDAAAGPLPGQYSAEYTRYPDLDLTAPVVASGPGNADGCAPFADPARVRGALVLLEWADDDAVRACGSAPRAEHAFAAGAVGVLLTSGLADFGSVGIAGTADLPVFQLTGPATTTLRPLVADGTARVRLAGALADSVTVRTPEIADTPNPGTSRGHRAPAVKPDVAGPGTSITSAASGTGAGRASRTGTSMAAPFVAGVAALVREEHPAWSPAQVKAAIVNTAADVHAGPGGTGPLMAPMRVGSGRVDAAAALATPLLAADAGAPEAVAVTFGVLEAPVAEGPLTRSREVRVSNAGPLPAVLGAVYEPILDVPGTRVALAPSRVVVPPGGSALVTVRLSVDPVALRRVADPTVELRQAGLPRQYPADVAGRVVLTPLDLPPGTSAGPLRVPVSAHPKPVSDLVAARGPGGAVTFTGPAVDQGAGPAAYRSRAGVFRLVAESPRLPRCAGRDAAAGCVVNGTGSGGDLRFVGVGSTLAAARAAGTPEQARLAFAVATWADLFTVGTVVQPAVDIDVDGDDVPDFSTLLTKLPGTDVLVARTVDLHRPLPDGGFAEVDVQPVNGHFGDVDTNVLDTDVWVLPVRLAALGIDLTAATAPIRFLALVVGAYGPPAATEPVIDVMAGPADVDALDPALGAAPPGAGPAAVLHPVTDGAALAADAAAGPLLVVLNQNRSGSRAAVLR